MNYFFKKQVSVWLLVLLLLINIAAISTIVYHIYFGKDIQQTSSTTPDVSQMIFKELNFNEDQKIKFSVMKDFYNQQSQPVTSKMEELRNLMLLEISDTHPDTLVLDSVATEMGKLHTALKKNTISYILGMKSLCDSSQQENLSQMINHMLKTEGPFKGMGRQNRYRHGQGAGKGWQKNK